mgnify:CR=1 FL=1
MHTGACVPPGLGAVASSAAFDPVRLGIGPLTPAKNRRTPATPPTPARTANPIHAQDAKPPCPDDTAGSAFAEPAAAAPAPPPPPPPAPPLSPTRLKEVPKSAWSLIPRSCAANVLPRSRPAMPALRELRASPHNPVAVTPDPAAAGGVVFGGSADPRRQLPLNGTPVEVESDMFIVGGGGGVFGLRTNLARWCERVTHKPCSVGVGCTGYARASRVRTL